MARMRDSTNQLAKPRDRTISEHDHEPRYKTIRRFGQIVAVKNPDFCNRCIKREYEKALLPEQCGKRNKSEASSSNHDEETVSTELTLYDHTWIRNNPHLFRPYLPTKVPDQTSINIASNISRMRFESDTKGVSTELKLFEYPWKITKRLEARDVESVTRLLFDKEDVDKHILPLLKPYQVAEIHTDGLNVIVCDLDTSNDSNNCYKLKFKYWNSNKSYVFICGWSRDFVERRGLKQGDEIGLYWHSYYRRFHFSLLKRNTVEEDV